MRILSIISSTILYLDLVCSWETFRDLIPNGYNLFHPCKKNTKWDGVGHKAFTGGGARNLFGRDFSDQGKKWTTALCNMDSDGDGNKNGEELGDPNCKWVANAGVSPERTTNITHPGVCEPVDSDLCKAQKDWISCSGKEFTCPALNETGWKTKDIRFPRTRVPAQETTYWCYIFELPSDQDYHVIADQPILDNTLVIHHMILSGCSEKVKVTGKPYSCLMGNQLCGDWLAAWTVGAEGSCAPSNAAVRFGKTSYKYAQLQVHWTNPRKRTDWYDSSGIRIFYTPKLRPNDIGTMAVGQLFLDIPGGKPEVIVTGECKGSCSKMMLPYTVNVTSVALHAHFLGRKMSVEQFRNGKKVRDLGRNDAYDYTNPEGTRHDPPVELLPGDELKTTCVYNSTKRQRDTYYGEGTFDEMCFGFIDYYPKFDKKRQRLCLSFERYSMCELRPLNASSLGHNLGKCNISEFYNSNYFINVFRTCGSSPKECSEACRLYVDRLYSHICMKTVHDGVLRMLTKTSRDMYNAVTRAKKICDNTTTGTGDQIASSLMLAVFCSFLLILSLTGKN